MKIVHLQRHEIDPEKWDACVGNAENGLIYSTVLYLDTMAPGWSALVQQDYTAVMPLTGRRKWGFSYLYQPYLTAQSGITGRVLSEDIVHAFLNAVPRNFTYWDISLNWGNAFNLSPYRAPMRRNYILPLGAGAGVIRANYRSVVKRNVKKALNNGCTVDRNVSIDAVVQLAERYTHGTKQYGQEIRNFKRLTSRLQKDNKVVVYGVRSRDGLLVASAVFLFFRDRAYYILVGNHPQGRRTGASHLLIDAFINDQAGKPLTLDFEGSDLPGLAFYYSSFGAKEENYPALRYNRLPWFARWMKK